MRFIDFFGIIVCMCTLYVLNEVHNDKKHEETMIKLDSIYNEYHTINQRIWLTDSLHYSKCDFQLREGILTDLDN